MIPYNSAVRLHTIKTLIIKVIWERPFSISIYVSYFSRMMDKIMTPNGDDVIYFRMGRSNIERLSIACKL